MTYSSFYNFTPAISRVVIGQHLIFAHPRDQRAVTRLENVPQLSIRQGKKLGFQLSHRQHLNFGKFLKILFLQNTFRRHLLDFYSFYRFLPPSELIETSLFSIFECFIAAFERDEYYEFKRSSCCCMGKQISR